MGEEAFSTSQDDREGDLKIACAEQIALLRSGVRDPIDTSSEDGDVNLG